MTGYLQFDNFSVVRSFLGKVSRLLIGLNIQCLVVLEKLIAYICQISSVDKKENTSDLNPQSSTLVYQLAINFKYLQKQKLYLHIFLRMVSGHIISTPEQHTDIALMNAYLFDVI